MTTATATLTEFLLARIAEDEAVAREASRHDTEPIREGGEHWRWECPEDEVVRPNFDMEFMECSHEHWSMSLRSAEQYPYRSFPGVGPSIRLSTDSELASVIAAHIARHDPARVLAECEAKRRIVEHVQRVADRADPSKHPAQEYVLAKGATEVHLRILAAVYAGHAEFREEWRP